MRSNTPFFVKLTFKRKASCLTGTRVVLALLVGFWCVAACANGGGASFGVSATVIHRILAQTPTGTISTLCDQSICPAPVVSVDPVDNRTGTRIVRITY